MHPKASCTRRRHLVSDRRRPPGYNTVVLIEGDRPSFCRRRRRRSCCLRYLHVVSSAIELTLAQAIAGLYRALLAGGRSAVCLQSACSSVAVVRHRRLNCPHSAPTGRARCSTALRFDMAERLRMWMCFGWLSRVYRGVPIWFNTRSIG
jgi:hypothetical protein